MKITPEHYCELRDDIMAVAAALNIASIANEDAGESGLKAMHGLLDVVNRNRAYDDTHPAFAMGVWTRRLPFTGRKYCHLYDAGLNDTHIATALRAIKAEMTLTTESLATK